MYKKSLIHNLNCIRDMLTNLCYEIKYTLEEKLPTKWVKNFEF
jgi:hypothetical protein